MGICERYVLGFTDAVEELVPAVTHDGAHAEEHDAWTESLGGEVALQNQIPLAYPVLQDWKPVTLRDDPLLLQSLVCC
jgi:hypothetical protein